jgi:hypothetical protein
MTELQFIAELQHRSRMWPTVQSMTTDDLHRLMKFVWKRVMVDEDAPNSFPSMKQKHVGDWSKADGTSLSRAEKKDFIENSVCKVGSDPKYMETVELENAAVVEEMQYNRLENTMLEMCDALACDNFGIDDGNDVMDDGSDLVVEN